MHHRIYLWVVTLTQLTTLFGLNRYPEWFLYPPKYPGVVTGFSYGGEPPVTDAERMYCVYQECLVTGTLQQFQNYEQHNSDYFYDFDADSLRAIHGRLRELDSFYTEILRGGRISAFSRDSLALKQVTPVDVDSLPPAWTDLAFYPEGAYYYGVGMYTSRANRNDAWKTAEEKAFFAIMSGLAMDIHSVLITNTGAADDYDRVSSIHLNYKLKGLTVVERWPDHAHEVFYVLVRIHRQNVFSPLLKQKSEE